ncbi:SRPBCC family protein [Aequorivita sp. 609]|uniref:SRPBCC family protein n=1 Tax=Aequorivita TaxID=153265 RepID=UPI00111FA065|nr:MULTISPECIES: SRPBCC family protein [Aequorivita]MBB6680765.1 SRPBCC family protein [Aequorivita sp. 609]NGX83731.1 SRPBCC family protein [Aequorivita sp. KMM 9714]
MKLNSKKVTVQKSASELCEFLADVKNYEGLMPDTISKFEVIRDNAFVFALKGMPEIALEIKEVDSPNKVVLGAISDKLPFTLKSDIESVSDTSSTAELLFEGEFNSMMAMMIKSPISKFIETLASNLEKL